MVSISVAFEVFCSCGEDLSKNVEVKDRHGSIQIIVAPCEKCLKHVTSEGYAVGLIDGYGNGIADGRMSEYRG